MVVSADYSLLCELAECSVKKWYGLHDVTINEMPICLGQSTQKGIRHIQSGTLMSKIFQKNSNQSEVNVLYWLNGGAVELIEVKPLTPLEPSELIGYLGQPDSIFLYTEDEMAWHDIAVEDEESVEEYIYAHRGLSLLVVKKKLGIATVKMILAFKSMKVEQYLNQYVCLQPKEIQ